MERNTTYGPSCKCKSHKTYPINEKFGNKTENPHCKNEDYIQTNKHNRLTICTFYTSPQAKTWESTTYHKPPKVTINPLINQYIPTIKDNHMDTIIISNDQSLNKASTPCKEWSNFTSKATTLGHGQECFTNIHSIHSGLLQKPEFFFFSSFMPNKPIGLLLIRKWDSR